MYGFQMGAHMGAWVPIWVEDPSLSRKHATKSDALRPRPKAVDSPPLALCVFCCCPSVIDTTHDGPSTSATTPTHLQQSRRIFYAYTSHCTLTLSCNDVNALGASASSPTSPLLSVTKDFLCDGIFVSYIFYFLSNGAQQWSMSFCTESIQSCLQRCHSIII